MKWAHSLGYFIQSGACEWQEYQNDELFGTYTFVKLTSHKKHGEGIVLLNVEEDNYVLLLNERSLFGNKINAIRRVLYKGRWMPTQSTQTFTLLNDLDMNIYLTEDLSMKTQSQNVFLSDMQREITSTKGKVFYLHNKDYSFNVTFRLGYDLFKEESKLIKASQLIPKCSNTYKGTSIFYPSRLLIISKHDNYFFIFKDIKWQNEIDNSYFVKSTDCVWLEKSEEGRLIASYKFVKTLVDEEGENIVLKQNNKMQHFVQIGPKFLYEGDTVNDLSMLKSSGSWI